MKYKITITDENGKRYDKGLCNSLMTAYSITDHVLQGKDCHTFVQIDKIGDELNVNL